MVGRTELLPEKFSTKYTSAIATGSVVDLSAGEKRQALLLLVKKYSPDYIQEGLAYIDKLTQDQGVQNPPGIDHWQGQKMTMRHHVEYFRHNPFMPSRQHSRQGLKNSTRYVAAVAGLVLAGAACAPGAVPVSGDLVTEAQRLEAFSVSPYGANSGNYVGPTTAQWTQFFAAASALFAGDLARAVSNATPLDYEVVLFTHTNTQQTFPALRSRETNGTPTRPWGTYFVNTNSAINAGVGAPHPQNDYRSPSLTAEIFLKSGARGFLLAGAHRNANGNNTADPGYLTNTIFHAVHVAWSGNSGENTAWQIHGYSTNNHPGFPANCRVVLSTGADKTNSMSTNLVVLDQQLEWNGIKTYAYNDALTTNDPLNVRVNEGVAGTNFDGLAATHNVQGQHSRALGGQFVHVELATIMRTNSTLRTCAADAIASAILLSRTNLPSPPQPLLKAETTGTNQFRFAFTAELFRVYQPVQRASFATGDWSVLYTFPGNGQTRTFTNTMTGDASFFRVQAE